MQCWLSSSLVRWYPRSAAGRKTSLRLEAARGEQASFQACYRTEAELREVSAAVAGGDLQTQVRRVGYVPLPHLNTDTPLDDLDGVGHTPGLVPDPLFPEQTAVAGPWETGAFWVTVRVPREAKPGRHQLQVTLSAEGEEPVPLTVNLRVHRGVTRARRGFPTTHWFYSDALCDWYKVEPFDAAFWPLAESYLRDLAEHHYDVSHVPLFTPPTDGVKRPTQLLDVHREGEQYRFDWQLVRQWVETARRAGLSRFEWTHLFSQWGVQYAIRIYKGHGGSEKLLWNPETPATSPTYRGFLSQFLPQFKRFLETEGLMERSHFHLSDEPKGPEQLASYRAARSMLRELAPWMEVMDAISEIEFAREGLTDIPIPKTSAAPLFIAEGYPAWVYYCCSPRGRCTQRLLDTPLLKMRMFGWLCYRLKAKGFLHWGHNYWYRTQTREMIDPFAVNDGHDWPVLAYGDTFVVYPGANGPIDSLRWEVFSEGLQDYALLQHAGVEPDDPALADIHDYAEFPREGQWLLKRRSEALMRLNARE